MCRTRKTRAFLLTLCLAILTLPGREAVPAPSEARPPHVLRMCILPFYTSASRAGLDGDLGPLLEAGLSGKPWLEVIPAKSVYEWSYTLEPHPWLVKGIWEEGQEAGEAEVYFRLRKRLLHKARARFPADYHVIGRVISTGMKKTLAIEVIEPGPRPEAVFTTVQGAEIVDAIPEAVDRAAAEIMDFLEPIWSVGYLEEVRRQYLAQTCSLQKAIRESEKQVRSHPERLALRVFLLSLYEEDREAYAELAGETAAEIVNRWDGHDEEAERLAQRTGVDPFLVLCREQARRGDWSGVRETSRLGREANPLLSAEYERWRLRARQELGLAEAEKNSTR